MAWTWAAPRCAAPARVILKRAPKIHLAKITLGVKFFKLFRAIFFYFNEYERTMTCSLISVTQLYDISESCDWLLTLSNFECLGMTVGAALAT